MAATIGESALRRYGRANYDVSARLQVVGDELYVRTRASLDDEEVEDVNGRLSRATYSRSVKAYPRRSPSSPRISVVIASPYAPFTEVSSRQLDLITSRLLRPTLVSKLRETTPPAPRTPPPPPKVKSRLNYYFPVLLPPQQGILRAPTPTAPETADGSAGSADPSGSPGVVQGTTGTEDKSSGQPAAPVAEESSKGDAPSPKVRFALKGAPKSKSQSKPETQNVRSKSAPARSQRTLPVVSCPRGCPKPAKSKKEPTGSGKPASPRKSRRSPDRSRGSTTRGSTRSDGARSQSSLSDRPKRLGFIATILEAENEYED